jgi:hypothetical protein
VGARLNHVAVTCAKLKVAAMRVDALPETRYRTEKSNKQHTQNWADPTPPQPVCGTKIHIESVTSGNVYDLPSYKKSYLQWSLL